MLDARRRALLDAIGVERWVPRQDRLAGDSGGEGGMHASSPRPAEGTVVHPGSGEPAGPPRPPLQGAADGQPHGAAGPPSASAASTGNATSPAVGASGRDAAPPADNRGRPSGPPAIDETPDGDWSTEEPVPSDFSDYAAFAAGSETSPVDMVATLDWPALKTAVAGCTACALHETRTQTVFGVGDENAGLMVIGEAPGGDEDRQGEPFVGRAGQLLNAMLEAIGLAREQVYIANIIKCRPPGNRDPQAEEIAACRRYLLRQIELVQPRVILSVGRVSAHNLLDTDQSLSRLRGRTHHFGRREIPLRVTYHPAYLLRRPAEKAKAWQDLQAAYRLLVEGQLTG